MMRLNFHFYTKKIPCSLFYSLSKKISFLFLFYTSILVVLIPFQNLQQQTNSNPNYSSNSSHNSNSMFMFAKADNGDTLIFGDSIFSGAANLVAPEIRVEPLVISLRTLIAADILTRKGLVLNAFDMFPNYARAGARILPHSYYDPNNEDIAPVGVPSPIPTQYEELTVEKKKGYPTILMDGGGNDILASLNICFDLDTMETLKTCDPVLDAVMRGIEVLWTKIGEDPENEVENIVFLGYYHNGLVDPLIDFAMDKLFETCDKWNESIEKKNASFIKKTRKSLRTLEEESNNIMMEKNTDIEIPLVNSKEGEGNNNNNNNNNGNDNSPMEIIGENNNKAAIEPIEDRRNNIVDRIVIDRSPQEDMEDMEDEEQQKETEMVTEENEENLTIKPKAFPKCYILDPRNVMTEDLISIDRIHPTWEGSYVLAQFIFDETKKVKIDL